MKVISVSSFAVWFMSVAVLSPVMVEASELTQDYHPYQSQSFFRLGAGAQNLGMIEVIPAITASEYQYRLPGDPKLHMESNTMFLYDKRNPLTETLSVGGNYIFFKGGYLATITADGTLLYKGRVSFSPVSRGGVFFVDQNGSELIAVDSFGFYVDTQLQAKNVKYIGGNYLIDSDGTLTTVKSMGAAPGNGTGIATPKTGWVFKEISGVGGNYFVKSDGTLVTISSITGFFKDQIVPDSKPLLLGGNYFIGQDRVLYTVSNDGVVLKNPDYVISNALFLLGASYMKLNDGSIITVDGEGKPHRSLMHVSTTGVRAQVEKTLPSEIEAQSIYMPNLISQ